MCGERIAPLESRVWWGGVDRAVGCPGGEAGRRGGGEAGIVTRMLIEMTLRLSPCTCILVTLFYCLVNEFQPIHNDPAIRTVAVWDAVSADASSEIPHPASHASK